MEKFKFDKNTQTAIVSSIITTVIILGGAFLFIQNHKSSVLNFLASTPAASKESATTEPSSPPFSQDSYVISAVKKANPAVVSIIISEEVPKYDVSYQQQANPFGDFFGGMGLPDNFFSVPQYTQNGTQNQEVGGGSGFLVTSDGLIVTNNHVVDQKDAEYTVYTNDGKKHAAKIIATDPVLDIAVIKIDGTGYPYLSFGDSDKLDIGQSVIAIGNALAEFRNTVSVGVVSGLARNITAGDSSSGSTEALDKVIQTDAAINPGNSGGPLLNLEGDVIGIDVAVAQDGQNIGFALPINSVKGAIESAEKTGKIVRPYLGIRYIAITSDIKDKNNLTVDYGILVQKGATAADLAVIPGSPADKAGIVENDIILEIDGVKIDQDQDFASLIREHSVGDTVKLTMLSKGIQKTVSVTLTAAPQS